MAVILLLNYRKGRNFHGKKIFVFTVCGKMFAFPWNVPLNFNQFLYFRWNKFLRVCRMLLIFLLCLIFSLYISNLNNTLVRKCTKSFNFKGNIYF